MKRAGILKLLTAFIVLNFLLPSGVLAQKRSKGLLQDEVTKKSIPIHIVSDRMIADNKNQWVHFIGNVTATRDELVIHSDRLEVYRDIKLGKINRIEAIGRVDISRGAKYATADKAVYYDDEQKIVLLGNPKAWENNNIVVGHKMNFYLETDQLIVEGDSKRRVDVVLYPSKETEKNQGRNSIDSKKFSSQ